jgi:hypothetical protein
MRDRNWKTAFRLHALDMHSFDHLEVDVPATALDDCLGARICDDLCLEWNKSLELGVPPPDARARSRGDMARHLGFVTSHQSGATTLRCGVMTAVWLARGLRELLSILVLRWKHRWHSGMTDRAH